ncbi:MAG: TlpA family protein disulfide reductase [Bacteroidia bacterium]
MRIFLFLIVLCLLASDPANAQSKKEVLKKAIEAYKKNPHPAFRGYSVHVSPFAADSIATEYDYGFSSDQERPVKYYSSETYKTILTLDSQYFFSFWNENVHLYKGGHSIRKKQLYEQNTHGAMPPSYTMPLNKLAEYYIRKKKVMMMDTTIDGETCYRFEFKIKDTFDPVTEMNVTGRKEIITISWETGLIREYGFYEKWDDDAYKDYYQFSYFDDALWQEKILIMNLEFSSWFADYAPPANPYLEKSVLSVGDTIQYWHFKQLGGDSIDIRTLNRNYYVLDFWHTGCRPCIGAIPQNNKLDSSIRQYNAQVLGITIFHHSDTFLANFKEKRNIQFSLFTHPGTSIETHFPIKGYPTYILINKEGLILHIEYGSVRWQYHQEIEDIIKAEATK